ncbi:MAG: Asp-tRNA(Asn)/Glu-tRNA(Gln) amidotransferase subunit GatA, partial [Bdellovibrionales bacterium]|nr:Asp-tRNA(Asn)/Glu-tRNA(Gln) amidotransferase subunit GatA [Bdellovibrionales bacterium]
SEAVAKKEIKAADLAKESLDRIQKYDKEINSFVTVNEKAIEEAEKIDKRIAAGENVGKLAGIPLGIKDMFCTKGIRTTACSNILSNFVPPYSATVVENVLKNGAIVSGKVSCDEFAMGSSNESSPFGPVKNPWKTTHVPGGSSGGSAASVAARLVSGSFGTDTGGSIRQPASFCGLVGIKPTYGRISRYGVVAFASSLDQAGPMTTNVKDAALMLECMSGYDDKDSTSSKKEVPEWSKKINSDVRGKKIGIPREFFGKGLSGEVRDAIEETIGRLKSAGVETVDVELPHNEYAVSTYYLICTSEASSNLARYDGVRYGHRSEKINDLDDLYQNSRGEGFGEEVKRRILLGTFALSSGYYDAYYLKACKVRRLIQNDFINAFKKCDVILGPVCTTPAFKIGERISDPLEMYMNDIYTVSTPLAGIPGMSVPVGLNSEGLPIGAQLLAPHFEEQRLFDVGSAIENLMDWNGRMPNGLQ